MPKRKNPEPAEPGCWDNRHEDPNWQPWMEDGVWSAAELEKVVKVQHEPVKLPLPFFSALDRSCLTAPAAQKLDEAIEIFEPRMSETHNALTISDLLTDTMKKEYDLNTPDGSYRLFLTGRFEFFYYGSAFFKGKPRSLQFNPIYEQIDDTKITSSP